MSLWDNPTSPHGHRDGVRVVSNRSGRAVGAAYLICVWSGLVFIRVHAIF